MINIAILLTKLGRTEEAVQLYQQILKAYQKSEVAERYHYNACNAVYNNLSRITKSEELAKKGFKIGDFLLQGVKLKYSHYIFFYSI